MRPSTLPLPSRRKRAFSLVEVTLAVGIVAFALVGIIGVMPMALSSGRQSVDQNHAVAIANTLYTSFRAQPFTSVCYLDEQFAPDGYTPSGKGPAPLNLATLIDAAPRARPAGTRFYATFIGTAAEASVPDDIYGNQRRLVFTAARPTVGESYLVELYFNNQPDGMASVGLANRVEIIISSSDLAVTSSGRSLPPLSDQFRFVSTVAKRTN